MRAFNKIAVRRFRARTKETRKLFLFYVAAGICIGNALSTYSSLYQDNRNLRADLFAVWLCLSLALVTLWLKEKYKRRIHKADDPDSNLSRLELAIDAQPEWLEVTSARVRASYPWSTFTDIAEDEQSIYLFLSNLDAVVIPKDAFAQREDMQLFRSWARGSNKLLLTTCE
jgi:hypothetical protein